MKLTKQRLKEIIKERARRRRITVTAQYIEQQAGRGRKDAY